MALQAAIRYENRYVKWVATAAHVSGEIVQTPRGVPGIVTGLKPVAIGDEVAADVAAVADVASASGTTFSAGDTVAWDDTAKLAVASPSDFDIGKADAAKVAGELTVRVAFNT